MASGFMPASVCHKSSPEAEACWEEDEDALSIEVSVQVDCDWQNQAHEARAQAQEVSQGQRSEQEVTEGKESPQHICKDYEKAWIQDADIWNLVLIPLASGRRLDPV